MFSSQFWTRCTIYDRHEARRARTLQLRGDERPTVVRILAGLPGFRTIIPQYKNGVVPAAAGAVAEATMAASSAASAAADAVSSGDYYQLSTTTVSFHNSATTTSLADDTATSIDNALASNATLSGLAAAVGITSYYGARQQRAAIAALPSRAPPVLSYQTLLLQQGRRTAIHPSPVGAARTAITMLLLIGTLSVTWSSPVSQCRAAATDGSCRKVLCSTGSANP